MQSSWVHHCSNGAQLQQLYMHSSYHTKHNTVSTQLSKYLAWFLQVWVQCLFLFALVWSVGANTDEEGRTTFDHMLRKLLINDPPPELKPYITVRPTLTPLFAAHAAYTCQEKITCRAKLAPSICLLKCVSLCDTEL